MDTTNWNKKCPKLNFLTEGKGEVFEIPDWEEHDVWVDKLEGQIEAHCNRVEIGTMKYRQRKEFSDLALPPNLSSISPTH